MPLTPLDIRNKKFRRSLRGYDEAEVDDFLEQVVREMDRLLKDNASLREQVETLGAKLEQYQKLEDTLHNTLVVAQQAADELKANAHRQAELTMAEARQRAERIITEAEGQVDAARQALETLVRRARVFQQQLRGMLTAQLELLDAEEGRLAGMLSESERGAVEAAAANDGEAGRGSERERSGLIGSDSGP